MSSTYLLFGENAFRSSGIKRTRGLINRLTIPYVMKGRANPPIINKTVPKSNPIIYPTPIVDLKNVFT